MSRVEVHPTLGRVVIATRSFGLGDVVLAEQPLIVFPSLVHQADQIAFLRAFADATPDAQAAILDVHHPPLDDDSNWRVPARRSEAAALKGFCAMSAGRIHKLLLISDTNAHGYTGHSVEFGEVVGPFRGPGRAALFDLGSKVAHSCRPNVLYDSKTAHGGLEYRACRPIAEGEMLTYSYIGDLWCSTIAERRAELLTTKAFVCMCPRCVQPDPARAVRCPNNKCASFALASDSEPRHGDASTKCSWRCEECGPVKQRDLEPALQTERNLSRTLESLSKQGQQGGLNGIPPSRFVDIAESAAKALSPAHRLVARAYEAAATFCASHAAAVWQAKLYGMRSEPHGSETSLRVEAAKFNRISVKVVECLAAGCHGGVHCPETHPTVHECANEVFFIGQDLREVPAKQRDSEVLALVARYVPDMEAMYGKTDSDVLNVVRMLAETAPPVLLAQETEVHIYIYIYIYIQI